MSRLSGRPPPAPASTVSQGRCRPPSSIFEYTQSIVSTCLYRSITGSRTTGDNSGGEWQLSAAHSFSQQRWRGGSRCVVGVWWSAWSMLTLCAVKCVFEKISLSTGHASITTVPPLHSTLSRAQLRGQPAAAQHQRVTRQTAHSLSSCASLSLLWPAGHRGAAASRPPRYRLSSSELCHLR